LLSNNHDEAGAKEEYEILVPKVINQMRKTGDWGRYLDPILSLMGYNETLAQEYFPSLESEIRGKNWNWFTTENEPKIKATTRVPENINEVDETICNEIFACRATGKAYKILLQELKFYKLMSLPLPSRCPEERHKERLNKRNPRKLWPRTCSNCGVRIETNFEPHRTEKVLCENCYLKQIY